MLPSVSLQGLLEFIQRSPTPYHAVAQSVAALNAAGFIALDEKQPWVLEPGQSYYFTRRDASLLAFRYGTTPVETSGFRLLGAHTDSPCLKVRPRPEVCSQGYWQLGADIYGGALLSPWFDRDLSIAGRVSVKSEQGHLAHYLIDFNRPIAVIPSLAIHLNRTVNDQRSINPQEEMRPILLQGGPSFNFKTTLAEQVQQQHGLPCPPEVLAYDLCFYDTQAPAQLGLQGDFISAARLDNLLSCYISLQALLHTNNTYSCGLLFTDHEEVGSQSDIGAGSNLLNSFLTRWLGESPLRYQALAQSLFISLDNAHGIHPNYPRKHEDNHGPLLNAGPVLKVDANQSYATSSETAAFIGLMAQQAEVPLQVFVTRADQRCGSTIGPMTAAQTGLRSVDIGLPTFAMHSIRELAGSQDATFCFKLLHSILTAPQLF